MLQALAIQFSMNHICLSHQWFICEGFCLSIQDEHFGIVPLEAMAAQKPVIACNSGGPVETIRHEVTGFLCDPTPLEFSKSMARLLADTEMAAKMGKEARRHVTEKFSTKTFGEQLNRYVLDTSHQGID